MIQAMRTRIVLCLHQEVRGASQTAWRPNGHPAVEASSTTTTCWHLQTPFLPVLPGATSRLDGQPLCTALRQNPSLAKLLPESPKSFVLSTRRRSPSPVHACFQRTDKPELDALLEKKRRPYSDIIRATSSERRLPEANGRILEDARRRHIQAAPPSEQLGQVSENLELAKQKCKDSVSPEGRLESDCEFIAVGLKGAWSTSVSDGADKKCETESAYPPGVVIDSSGFAAIGADPALVSRSGKVYAKELLLAHRFSVRHVTACDPPPGLEDVPSFPPGLYADELISDAAWQASRTPNFNLTDAELLPRLAPRSCIQVKTWRGSGARSSAARQARWLRRAERRRSKPKKQLTALGGEETSFESSELVAGVDEYQ